MEPLARRRSVVLLALMLLSGGVLLGAWLLPASNSKKSDANATRQNTSLVTANPSPQLDSDEGCRAEIDTLFGPVRTAQKLTNIAALIAFAADLRNHEALRDAVNAMSPVQCLDVFERLLLLNQPNSEGRAHALEAVSESLFSRDLKGQTEAIARWLLEQAKQFPDPDEAREYALDAVIAWSRADPRSAADFALTLAPEPEKAFPSSSVLTRICDNWAKSDPAAALAWAKTLSDTDGRKVYALQGVFGCFNEFDPDEAMRCVEQLLGANQGALKLTTQAANELAQRQSNEPGGSLAVAQWVLSLSDPRVRHEALEAVANGWLTRENLPQVVHWAETLPPSESPGGVWAAVAGYWEILDSIGCNV